MFLEAEAPSVPNLQWQQLQPMPELHNLLLLIHKCAGIQQSSCCCLPACVLQALHVFLEAEAPLGSNLQWQQLQPLHGSILEGVARLPKQLFGEFLSLHAAPLTTPPCSKGRTHLHVGPEG